MRNEEHAIVVEELKKDFTYYVKEEGFKGSLKNLFHKEMMVKTAVNNISFAVKKGEMVGFIGPNGAGKTTTLKMLTGIVYPTSGKIAVHGYNPTERKRSFKKNISIVMGQKSQLWWDLPAQESFNFNACLYEIPDQEYQKRLAHMSGLLGVEHLLNVQVRRLSLGERMKMELIAALLHNPEVVFLDEPTIGLDTQSQRTIREFLKKYNQEYQATITITSHYMNDITELCQRSIVIDSGEIVYDGELSDINRLFQSKNILKLRFAREVARVELESLGVIRDVKKAEVQLEVEKDSSAQILKLIMDRHQVIDFSMESIPIEESIEMLYKSGHAKGA